MTEQTIKIGNQEHVIETRPITLIFSGSNQSAGPQKEYQGCFRMDSDVTRYHGERVVKLHEKFDEHWRLFFANTSVPLVGENVPKYDMESRKNVDNAIPHLIGLIDLTLKLTDMKRRVVWIHPESFMHPGWAVALGDLAIAFQGEV